MTADPLWLNVAFGIAMTALTGVICEHKTLIAWARRPWRRPKTAASSEDPK